MKRMKGKKRGRGRRGGGVNVSLRKRGREE